MDAVHPAADAKSMIGSLDTSVAIVSGDPDRLQQVVWNLLSNAIKFTPGGKVEVRLECVGDYAQIRVSDTGMVSADFLPYV